MNALETIVGSINKKFHFGIGGIGDFLLLMSTFYDNIDYNEVDVVFVANNVKSIKIISRKFDKINCFYIIPMSAWQCQFEKTWQYLFEHGCVGTGVTPKNFMYVADWIECGKTDCFEYYGVKRHPAWAMPMYNLEENKVLVIQPRGGIEDKTKDKFIIFDPECFYKRESIFDKFVIIGTEDELKSYCGDYFDHDSRVLLCSDLNRAWNLILSCDKFIGVDSWGKTLAAMAGRQTIVKRNVYKTQLECLFGVDYDPGDNVFLKNWGFEFVD